MRDLFEEIQNYIIFLRKSGYNISFSNFNDYFHPFTEKLLQHEIHLHSVCSYLKSNYKTCGMCYKNKAKLSTCKIKKPVYSCCYAGVEEYIFPVYVEQKRIICIHISGYRNNLKRSKRNMEKISLLCNSLFFEVYEQLSQEKPTFKTVESFIVPLEYMLKALYQKCKELNKSLPAVTVADQLYISALKHINDNYMNDISAEDIANQLGYSVSYLRAVFKEKCGVSLQNKINDIRIKNSEFLLLNTTMSITDISFNCGFQDSNYFSVVFKKRNGVSPLLFRKNSK